MTLQELVKDVVARFAADPTAASVALSWLEDRQLWYASVARYTGKYAEGKRVVAKATGETMEACLAALVDALRRWLQPTGVKLLFTVIEEYDDAAPENFGSYLAEAVPAPGDVIQLKWLDGRDAHRARVESVLMDDLVLRVAKLEEAPALKPLT